MGTQMADMSTASSLPLMFEPGEIAPAEMGTPRNKAERPSTAPDYGDNNEKLPRALQLALQLLLVQFLNEGQVARRDEIRKARTAREYWKGLQYKYWSASDGEWHLPWDMREAENSDDEPRYTFVTNLYQAFGLSIMAVLSQDAPAVRLWPVNAEDPEDVALADAGSDIIELVERNNQIQELCLEEAFCLWTDGKVGAYVRYVADAQRFGWRDLDELGSEDRTVQGNDYQCPACGTAQPQSMMGVCQQCGNPIDQSNYRPPLQAQVPIVKSTMQVPDGQEVIDIVGSLELQTPPWANKQHQFPYLVRNQLVHRSKLKASFPWAAKKIGSSTIAPDDANAQYERTAMITLTSGGESEPIGSAGDLTANLVIYREAWLRPWAFYQLEDDKLTKQLLDCFPEGCAVGFAGDAYCWSRNESMDAHWRVMHALPGDGQNRPAIGTSFMSVQERYNVLSNLVMETIEHGIPSTWASTGVVDFDAIRESYVEPGAIYPATPPPDANLANCFYETQPTKIAPEVMPLMNELGGQTGQFLTGAFPALFGGEMSDNKTASGYGMARDQALGRIGLVWRRMKQFHADIMLLSVDCFRKNRSEDVCFTVLGKGSPKTKWIQTARLNGNVMAWPATDSQYPDVPALKRQVLQMLMASPDPLVQKVLGHPENLDTIKRIVGLEELVNPQEDARNHQHDEITQLLSDGQQGLGPVPGPPMGVDPASGQPIPGPPLSSVPVDELLDDHQVHFEVIQYWSESDAGRDLKKQNPMGYANVKAHALEHFNALKAQMLAAQPPAPPPGQGAQPAAKGAAA